MSPCHYSFISYIIYVIRRFFPLVSRLPGSTGFQEPEALDLPRLPVVVPLFSVTRLVLTALLRSSGAVGHFRTPVTSVAPGSALHHGRFLEHSRAVRKT